METPAYLGRGRGRGRGRGSSINGVLNGSGNISPWNSSGIANHNGMPAQSSPGGARNNMQGTKHEVPLQTQSSLGVEGSLSKSISRKQLSISTSQKQQEIHSKMQKMSDKISAELSDSSDDEEIFDEEILQKTTKDYMDVLEGTEETANQYLLDMLQSGAVTCLICIDSVKRQNAIWSCDSCACIFHLQCIQKWAKEGIGRQTLAAEGDISGLSLRWHCPKCRHEYRQDQCPTRYFCFCGKEEDPVFDPWTVPHSCGQRCLKPLQPSCGHECLLLCHPGPCPPCPKTVHSSCYCGRSKAIMRRCSKKEWSCGKPCNLDLSCGHHKCAVFCHVDTKCPPCPESSIQSCLCGKEREKRPCASPKWQCKKVCGKPLDCGEHSCEMVCHAGSCGECPRAGARTCPCGKTNVILPCTEDTPTCEDTCKKDLACGRHYCSQRCHYGPCQTCLQHVKKTCRCGRKSKEVPCSQVFTCDFKCTKMRQCGRHQCKKKCCDGNCAPCEHLCNRTLNCRNHKCPSPCHQGSCYPCSASKEVTCYCKVTKMTVPCGREKTTKPPRCKQLCKIPSECHHSKKEPHKCHYGKCPTCRQICGLPLPSCDHTCLEKCHAHIAAPVEKPKLLGCPIEKVPFKPRACGPCQTILERSCLGEHVMERVQCAEDKPFSCGRKCGRLLACENHVCEKECHVVKGAVAPGRAGKKCDHCEDICMKARPKGCIHDCKLPCHPGPCPTCLVHLKLSCHCRTIQLYIKCSEYNSSTPDALNDLLCCKGRCPKLLSCGHMCPKICHTGDCAKAELCSELTKVKCKCGRKKKDFPCAEVLKSSSDLLLCDDRCKEIKNKKTQAELEKIEMKKSEEIKLQQEELERFERKKQGKKRKPRKITETFDEPSLLSKHKITLAITFIVCLLAIALFYVMQ